MKPLRSTPLRFPPGVLAVALAGLMGSLSADTSRPAQSTDGTGPAVEPSRRVPVLAVAGMDVRTSTGRYIGSVRDIMIDPDTGAVAFFLVASGRLPAAAGTVRLVPAASIEPAEFDNSLSTKLGESEWQSLPTMPATALASAASRLPRESPEEEATGGLTGSQQAAGRSDLVRGAELQGRAANTPDGKHGRISEVLVDFRHGAAIARLSDKQAKRDYALPVYRLDLQPVDNRSTPGPGAGDSSKSDSRPPPQFVIRDGAPDAIPSRGEPSPSPTGPEQHSTDRNFDRDPVVQAAARAVRRAWDEDPSLARLDLHVTPENGRLVIRGRVPNAGIWERGRTAATAAATGIPIEDRVNIEDDAR